VLTCVSGGVQTMVADFPVFKIFRETTPLFVHNVCENVEWEGMHFRLRKYSTFFQDLLRSSESEEIPPKLYYVADGLDLFFNDLSEVMPDAPVGLKPEEAAAMHRLATARLIVERYEAIVGSEGQRKPIVASTERLCGWGGAKLCSDEDMARYPPSPTDSRFLNAGGYLGPAKALATMILAVLNMKESATGDEQEKSRDSDQYFFKRYFWDNPDKIAMDYNQSIFGNFLEVVNKPCENDWVPQCDVKPCCTESDNFREFHRIFYGRYQVRGCAVWRGDNLPVSWHGNGAGKWLYLLALDRLSLFCPSVANLTLTGYPTDSLRHLFGRFNHRSASGDYAWRSGFLLRHPSAPLDPPNEELSAECAQYL